MTERVGSAPISIELARYIRQMQFLKPFWTIRCVMCSSVVHAFFCALTYMSTHSMVLARMLRCILQ